MRYVRYVSDVLSVKWSNEDMQLEMQMRMCEYMYTSTYVANNVKVLHDVHIYLYYIT